VLPPRWQTPLRHAGRGDGLARSFFRAQFLAVDSSARATLRAVREAKRASDVCQAEPSGAFPIDVRRAAQPNNRSPSKRPARAGRISTASARTRPSLLLRLKPNFVRFGWVRTRGLRFRCSPTERVDWRDRSLVVVGAPRKSVGRLTIGQQVGNLCPTCRGNVKRVGRWKEIL